jgi:hypothetical protein
MSLVGAGSHPAGRFPTSLFVLGSPVREAAMKSPRSLQSCPAKQRSRNQSDRRNRRPTKKSSWRWRKSRCYSTSTSIQKYLMTAGDPSLHFSILVEKK